MPKSKHRRKGKPRSRGKVNMPPQANIPPWPVTDPKFDAMLMARLRKMYGGNGGRGWTDAQIDAAIVEISYEEVDAAIKRRAKAMERAASGAAAA